MGVFIYELINGRPPFESQGEKETQRKIKAGKLEFTIYFSPEAKDLISRVFNLYYSF